VSSLRIACHHLGGIYNRSPGSKTEQNDRGRATDSNSGYDPSAEVSNTSTRDVLLSEEESPSDLFESASGLRFPVSIRVECGVEGSENGYISSWKGGANHTVFRPTTWPIE